MGHDSFARDIEWSMSHVRHAPKSILSHGTWLVRTWHRMEYVTFFCVKGACARSCMHKHCICDAFIGVTWIIHMGGRDSCVRDMIHSYVCETRVRVLVDALDVCHDSFKLGTWLIHVCHMTHSHVEHDSFTRVCHDSFSCVCHDSSRCVTWHIHTRDMEHSHMWHIHTWRKRSWSGANISLNGARPPFTRVTLTQKKKFFLTFDMTHFWPKESRGWRRHPIHVWAWHPHLHVWHSNKNPKKNSF